MKAHERAMCFVVLWIVHILYGDSRAAGVPYKLTPYLTVQQYPLPPPVLAAPGPASACAYSYRVVVVTIRRFT